MSFKSQIGNVNDDVIHAFIDSKHEVRLKAGESVTSFAGYNPNYWTNLNSEMMVVLDENSWDHQYL